MITVGSSQVARKMMTRKDILIRFRLVQLLESPLVEPLCCCLEEH